jgi:ABC-type transport system involved in cytochrome bd biosynthesis fused ATPase/permease subunit
MIAHRLSTIQSCDNIIVLENGRIAEQGDHGELLKKDGIYVTLVQIPAKAAEINGNNRRQKESTKALSMGKLRA